jgi:hypothetical protein
LNARPLEIAAAAISQWAITRVINQDLSSGGGILHPAVPGSGKERERERGRERKGRKMLLSGLSGFPEFGGREKIMGRRRRRRT